MWEMFLQLLGVMTLLALGGWSFIILLDKLIYEKEQKDED